MRLTIVKPDNIVSIDGITNNINLTQLPENLRVVQWQDISGHVEWTNQANTDLFSLADYQWVVDAWQTNKDIHDAIAANPYYGLNVSQIKEAKKVLNRQACETHITSLYPLTKQSSMSLGIYPVEDKATMVVFITACIAEENRVAALIDAATTVEGLELVENPTWPTA